MFPNIAILWQLQSEILLNIASIFASFSVVCQCLLGLTAHKHCCVTSVLLVGSTKNIKVNFRQFLASNAASQIIFKKKKIYV